MHKPGAVLLEKRLNLLAYNNIFYWFLRVSPMIPQVIPGAPVENHATSGSPYGPPRAGTMGLPWFESARGLAKLPFPVRATGRPPGRRNRTAFALTQRTEPRGEPMNQTSFCVVTFSRTLVAGEC
jgi:hypothetical protein